MALGQALIEHDLRKHPYAGFEPLARLLGESDVCFSNLEVAIDAPGAGKPTKTGIYFHAAEPAALDCLRAMSVNLLSLSNNHAWDLGAGGLRTTIREVEARGFVHAGAGNDAEAAAAPAVLKTPRGSIALVAMASSVAAASIARSDRFGVNHLAVDTQGRVDPDDARRNLRAVTRAAEQADYVLVYQHNHYWAPDWKQTPAWQPPWARQCIDAGATLFVNHGVPLLHGIELYRGAPIFYSLGNFVFHTHTPPGHYIDEVWESVAAEIELSSGRVRGITLHPLRLTDGIAGDDFFPTRGRPQLAPQSTAAAILRRVQQLSQPRGTKLEIDAGRGRIAL